jgi:hypothetical protein
MKNKAHYLKERVKPGALAQPVKKSCKNCLKGKRLGFNNDVLCREKGIVSADYYCPSHRFFIMDEIKKTESLRCSECQFFVFHSHVSIPAYGVCDMFSVRKCDGSTRKACSKFVRRREHIA